MTNGDKYLRDGVVAKELWKTFQAYYYKNKSKESDVGKAFINFFEQPAKPTLTEDERVILRNLRYEKGAYEYTKIGRTDLDSEGRCDLILIDSDNESVWWGEYGHLFQFIKERRRIRDKGIIGGEMSKPHKVNLIWIKGEYILKEFWDENYGTITHHIWDENKQVLVVNTGGWSKNEEIIERLSKTMFWHLYWQESKRGGQYIFSIGYDKETEKNIV